MTTDTITPEVQGTVPASGPRTVRTKSGSLYRIDGRTVLKVREDGQDTRFELVDVHKNRLRYTDGARLFISSEMVAA